MSTLIVSVSYALKNVRPLPADVAEFRVWETRTRYGQWWAGHEGLLQVVAVAALGWGTVYLTWRIGWSSNGANPVLWSALLVCELFGWWSLFILTWFSWSARPTTRPKLTVHWPVDVYVCTYDESVEVLRQTLIGCRALRYPHITYVLDDGRRPEVEALAAVCGARYLTRPDNRDAKAGNINSALPNTLGELVFILDADHIPMPDALDALVGYFDDPRVAIVQSPHDFLNHDSFQHYSTGRHEQSVFFGVICPGKDRHGAAFWCGSAAMTRRAALISVGGVATQTIAEDFHTTILLQRHGWTTRYHDEILVQGLAPHDLASYLLQRDRWARGNLAVFATAESPLRARELTRRQRFSYFASLSAYLAGPVRIALLVVLSAALWSGDLPISADLGALAAFWLPSALLSLLAGSVLTRGQMRLKEAAHFELLTAEIHLRALRCIVRPGRTTFNVTPKEGIDEGGWHALRQLPLLLLLGAALVVGVAARLPGAAALIGLPPLHGLAAIVIPAVAVLEARRVLRTLWWVARRRQSRTNFRFPTDAPATLELTGELLPARVVDVSGHGLGIETVESIALGTLLHVTAWLPGRDGVTGRVDATATVTTTTPTGLAHRLGLQIVVADDESRNTIAEHCVVELQYRQLRALHQSAPVRLDQMNTATVAA